MAEDKKSDDYAIEMGERRDSAWQEPTPPPRSATIPVAAVANNPILPVLSYCGSSILMTVTNKYVLSGRDFNLNFFLLCVQVRRRTSRPAPPIHPTLTSNSPWSV